MISISTAGEQQFLNFFGLDHHPFPVAPDDENFFISEYIEQVSTEIIHGIISRKGFIVLTGDVGLGKTTISRRLITILEEHNVATSLVLHTSLQDVELLAQINRDFGIHESDGQKPDLKLVDQMTLLNAFLLEKNREGTNCAIIIDDAQNLNAESLELVRMISNLEAGSQKLVQILLVGQPELMDHLATSELRQLRSRVVINAEAKPLGLEELKNYIAFKLNMTGNKGQIRLERSAIRRLYKYTLGNFRQVNILMDRALYVACLYGTRNLDGHILVDAFKDLYPDRARKNKKMIALAASIVMALLMTGGGLTAHGLLAKQRLEKSSVARSFQISTKPAESLLTAPDSSTPSNASEAAVLPGSETRQAAADEAAVKTVRNEETAFLTAYGLSRFSDKFAHCVKANDFFKFADDVYDQTGFRLVQLDRIPDNIENHYPAYNLILPSGRHVYLVFWKPAFKVDHFYYYYKGEEIRRLQEMLAGIRLYVHGTDGIVGSRLMQAVVGFQRRAGIPVTGYPDDTTLFLLFHAKGNIQNG